MKSRPRRFRRTLVLEIEYDEFDWIDYVLLAVAALLVLVAVLVGFGASP